MRTLLSLFSHGSSNAAQGVRLPTAQKICDMARIHPFCRFSELPPQKLETLKEIIQGIVENVKKTELTNVKTKLAFDAALKRAKKL